MTGDEGRHQKLKVSLMHWHFARQNQTGYPEIQHSCSISAKNSGGDLGSFTRSQYPELFEAAIKMKKGDLNGPIKIRDRQFGEGYAVIKLVDKTEEKLQPLEEVKDNVIKLARAEKDNRIYQNWVENAKARYKIEVYDEVIESTVKEKEEVPAEEG